MMAMPWLETDPMFERHHFTQDLTSGLWTMTALRARYSMSRTSGYRFVARADVSRR
jgi:hypothetical protein